MNRQFKIFFNFFKKQIISAYSGNWKQLFSGNLWEFFTTIFNDDFRSKKSDTKKKKLAYSPYKLRWKIWCFLNDIWFFLSCDWNFYWPKQGFELNDFDRGKVWRPYEPFYNWTNQIFKIQIFIKLSSSIEWIFKYNLKNLQ